MPIKVLNQFCVDWVIKARVVKKGNVRSWKNARGEGKLIAVDIIDRAGTLMQATAFNETALMLEGLLVEGKCYTFSNGHVKLSNKRFTSIKNDYCLTFDSSVVIEKCMDDPLIKNDRFSFTSIAGIEELKANQTVDVIGFTLEVG